MSKRKFLIIFCSVIALCVAGGLIFVNLSSGPVAYSEYVQIGNVEQYIQVNGQDSRNPLLLYLHGGPGFPVSQFAGEFEAELQKHFTIVHWDQRGAGRSFSEDLPAETLNLEQMLADTIELTDYLRSEFAQDKIYLLGHSWGSILGLNAAEQHPEKYFAYIGVGQAVNQQWGEVISYDFVYQEAIARGNREAVSELETIGPPPYENLVEALIIQRKWVSEFKGDYRLLERDTINQLISDSIDSEDARKLNAGNQLSGEKLLPTVMELNFFEKITSVELPVYFVMGRHDYMTPLQVVAEYYEVLDAPHKELIIFDDSAHTPNWEEAERFAEEMKRIHDRTN